MRNGGKTKTLIWTIMLASIALAGCAGEDAPEPVSDFSDLELEATADTGIIRGVVVDSTITPIDGATVSVSSSSLEEPLTTVTTADGLFGFDGLVGGTYFVTAEKFGYLAGQQSADVLPNVPEPDMVKILLEVDPEQLPYVELFQWTGFIECSFSLVLVRFAACSGVGNDNFIEEYSFSGPPAFVQSEMAWDSTQALGDEMQLSITDTSTGTQVRINATSGPSPILVGISEAQINEFGIGVNNTPWWRVFNDGNDDLDFAPDEEIQEAWGGSAYPIYNSTAPAEVQDAAYFVDECIMWPTLFSACMGAGAPGATIQQEFEVFTHAFYNFSPPAGWQFSVDGTPEPPTT